MTRGIKPSKKQIISGIKEAWKLGVDLRTRAVQLGKYRWLYRTHKYYFPDWKAALSAARINYNALKYQKIEEDRQRYLQDLREAYKEGVDLSAGSLQKDRAHKSLYEKGKRYYSGTYLWEEALSDAGLPVEKIVRQRAWDKDKVKERFLKRAKSGKPIHSHAVKKDEYPLYKAAIDHFSSYDDALRFSGFNPRDIKVGVIRNNQEIRKTIIEYYVKGIDLRPLNIKLSHDKNLRGVYHTAVRRFKGWRKALLFCGINPDRYLERFKGWNKENIKQELLRLYKEGEDLSTSSIIENNHKLYSASIRHYGSYEKALKSIGLNYEEIRRCSKPYTKEEIINRIKKLIRKERN